MIFDAVHNKVLEIFIFLTLRAIYNNDQPQWNPGDPNAMFQQFLAQMQQQNLNDPGPIEIDWGFSFKNECSEC